MEGPAVAFITQAIDNDVQDFRGDFEVIPQVPEAINLKFLERRLRHLQLLRQIKGI